MAFNQSGKGNQSQYQGHCHCPVKVTVLRESGSRSPVLTSESRSKQEMNRYNSAILLIMNVFQGFQPQI